MKSQYNALGYLERIRETGTGNSAYYQLTATDASGRVTQEWLGDGSLTAVTYDGTSGRIDEQHTTNGVIDIQHFSYDYDTLGNMEARSDVLHGLTETFTFDNLERLTSAQVTGASAVNYNFDAIGNITEKSDTGNPYSYTTSALHAVTQIQVGPTTQHLNYDIQGNLQNGDDLPTITWASYNKPTQLTKGGVTYQFAYGPNRSRYKKVHGSETTHYVGGSHEKIIQATSTIERDMVKVRGRVVMLRKHYSSSSITEHEYVHRDHLGSTTALTREVDGSVIERYSYDAWGKRRNATNWTSAVTSVYESRGYTGHEHLDDIDVIHMDGRIYSPKLGRMLSPDPITQAPNSGRNYNRYTYAFNNPLSNIDPSGYACYIASAGGGVSSRSCGNPYWGGWKGDHALDQLWFARFVYNTGEGLEFGPIDYNSPAVQNLLNHFGLLEDDAPEEIEPGDTVSEIGETATPFTEIEQETKSAQNDEVSSNQSSQVSYLNLTVFFGPGGSFVIGPFGGEVAAGFYLTIGNEPDLGVFGSFGNPEGSLNYNFLTSDLSVGIFNGTSEQFASPTTNTNLVFGPVAATGIYSPDLGQRQGTIFGISPYNITPVNAIGFSATNVQTRKAGLRGMFQGVYDFFLGE